MGNTFTHKRTVGVFALNCKAYHTYFEHNTSKILGALIHPDYPLKTVVKVIDL